MKDIRVGFALCGSFCTHRQVLSELEKLCGQYRQITPILSETCRRTDTRFGTAADLVAAVERHYIPEAAAYYVAERLGVKPTQVYDVISFYTALHDKPRAKFTLEVCSSAPCRVKDSDTLLERLKRLLNLEVGQVTYDGRFSIEQVPCFGACDVSPAVRVNGVVYGHLDSEERILDMLQQLN